MERLTLMRGWMVCIGLLAALALCGPAAGFAAGQSIDSLEKQAQQLFEHREDIAAAQQAIGAYQKILQIDPNHELAMTRLAKLYIWVGFHKGEDLEIYNKAVDIAEKAVQRHPDKPGPRYWLGAAYGLKATAPETGSFTCLSLLEPIENQMKTLMAIDPTYEFGGAWRVLGRLNTKMPFLLGGDKDLAVKYLRKAIEVGPNYYLNHLYLADLLNRLDQREEAFALLRQVVKGKPMPGFEPETRLWQRTAKEELFKSAKLGVSRIN